MGSANPTSAVYKIITRPSPTFFSFFISFYFSFGSVLLLLLRYRQIIEGDHAIRFGPQANLSRRVRLVMGVDSAVRLEMGKMRWLINGETFRPDAFPIDAQRNTIETWSLYNAKRSMPHPMHMHGFHFQILSRENSPKQIQTLGVHGGGRTVSDLGWKDTVLVWPGETVRLAVDFSHQFDGNQTYVFHCHNLEHEDSDMMVNMRVRT